VKYYEKLVELGCFSRQQLVEITGSAAAASSLIYDYLRKGYIERIRHDLYAVISFETKQPVPSRYQIGSSLYPDACITHHSAFEVYGYANQVFYEIYIATSSRFVDFEYNGNNYHRIAHKTEPKCVIIANTRVTELEQTVIDSIQDFEKVSGLEETLRCIMLVPSLNAEKLLTTLDVLDNGFLYQKCGYILEESNSSLGLPEWFFQECMKHSAKSKRYLLKEKDKLVYNKKWSLYVPNSIINIVNKGISEYDAV